MELQNLQSIFNDRIFRIPDYQRGYSWGKQQLQDLWHDIEILDDVRPHYMDVLSVRSDIENKDIIYVVDGQQRLSTLIILMQVICNCDQLLKIEWINNREKKDYEKKYLHRKTGDEGSMTEVIFGYEEDNPSHIYFKTKILELRDNDCSVPEHTLYTVNLNAAKEFFQNKIKDMSFKDLEFFVKKITEQLKFNYYDMDNDLNEFVAFETMNNRGKQLSNLERLKNRLIYLSTLIKSGDQNEKNKLRKNINDVWKTIYEYLGKNPNRALNDDNFLRDHWIMCFQYSRNTAKVYRDFLLNSHFTAENVLSGNMNMKDIQEYITDMQEVVKSYYWMHNPTDSRCEYSDDVKKWLSKLYRLGFRAFRPLVASALTKQTDELKIQSILKFAEQFNFVMFRIHFHNSGKGDNKIYNLVNDLHRHPDKIDDTRILEYFNSCNVRISTDCQKEKFRDNIDGNGSKFYTWKGLKYFLYEYELYLQKSKNNKEQKVQWENVDSETIEHICPQTLSDEWKKNFNHDEHKSCLHDLGNLLLLSHRKNAGLQNSSFAIKKQQFKSGSYSAIEVCENDDWTPDAIVKRRDKMLDFLWRRWGLSGRARLER